MAYLQRANMYVVLGKNHTCLFVYLSLFIGGELFSDEYIEVASLPEANTSGWRICQGQGGELS